MLPLEIASGSSKWWSEELLGREVAGEEVERHDLMGEVGYVLRF